MSYLLTAQLNLRIEGLGVFNVDVLIVVVVFVSMTGSFVSTFVVDLAFNSELLSFFNSLLGFVDFSLSDLAVSFVSPHGVGSEIFSSSVEPGLIRDVLNGSSGVVIRDFHSGLVLKSVDGLDLSEESLLFLKFIKGPSGADFEDFSTGIGAVSLSVDDFASLEGLDGSHATSGELISGEDEVRVASRGEIFNLPSFLLGFIV